MRRLTPFLLVLLLSASLWGQNEPITIVRPADKTLHKEAFTSFVMQVVTEIDRIELTDQNGTHYRIDPELTRPIYCQNIPLQLGLNRITVTAYAKDKILYTTFREVYYTSPVFKAYKYPPAGFKASPFHTDANEKRCAICHKMEANERKGFAFEDVKDSNCYGCHNPLTSMAFAHAPAVNFLCSSCHEADQNNSDTTKYPIPRKIQQKCFSCHKKLQNEWDEKRFRHDPVATGRCDKCHNPHASEQENFLRKPVWELCTSCHADKMNQSHVITVFSSKIHPVRGKPDPSRPGKEISCISCHNPHAANTRSLLPTGGGSIMKLCGKCHIK